MLGSVGDDLFRQRGGVDAALPGRTPATRAQRDRVVLVVADLAAVGVDPVDLAVDGVDRDAVAVDAFEDVGVTRDFAVRDDLVGGLGVGGDGDVDEFEEDVALTVLNWLLAHEVSPERVVAPLFKAAGRKRMTIYLYQNPERESRVFWIIFPDCIAEIRR